MQPDGPGLVTSRAIWHPVEVCPDGDTTGCVATCPGGEAAPIDKCVEECQARCPFSIARGTDDDARGSTGVAAGVAAATVICVVVIGWATRQRHVKAALHAQLIDDNSLVATEGCSEIELNAKPKTTGGEDDAKGHAYSTIASA